MKCGFTLVETLLALVLLGILGVLGGSILLKIYQNYHWKNQNLTQEIQVQNTLSQIKRVLENSYLESLMLSSGEAIGERGLSLRGKSLAFYERAQEYVGVGDYALPCLVGVFEPKSLRFSNVLALDFLSLDSRSNGILNQKCATYKKPNMPQKALFITSDFIAPHDFYATKFQGKILGLNASQMLLEIPPIFRNFAHSNPLQIAPKVYFLDSVSYLHFSDSIVLESQSRLQNVSQNRQEIIQEITDVKISKTSLGFVLELCVKDIKENPYCVDILIVELEK